MILVASPPCNPPPPYLCTAGLISAFLSTCWEALSAANATAVKSSLHSGKAVYLSSGRGQAALSACEWDVVATRAETAGRGRGERICFPLHYWNRRGRLSEKGRGDVSPEMSACV